MKRKIIFGAVGIFLLFLFLGWFFFLRGSGGLTRMMSVTGIYVIEKPRGYDVACFGDASNNSGYLSCLPLNAIKTCPICKCK